MIRLIGGLLVFLAIAAGAYYGAQTYLFVDIEPIPAMDHKDTEFAIEGKRIKLNSGRAEIVTTPEAAPTIIQYFGNEARGDMNRDGIEDTAFLITSDGGGSGTFYYVGVALQSADRQYYGTNTILLGDRIAPQSTSFMDGRLVVNYAVRAEGDAMTDQPSIGVSRYFTVESGSLREIISGPEWLLDDTGEVTDSGAPITTVKLKLGEQVRDIGTYDGSCFVINQSEWKLLEGETSGVICWWAGGGKEIGIFEENGARLVKVGDIEEGTAEEPGIRDNFETLFSL